LFSSPHAKAPALQPGLYDFLAAHDMIRKKCKALFRSDHAQLVVPEDRQQDDDWQRDAQQPKQQSASESHDESPQR
jgi:hypothetical protein